jgi:type IV pilus assembly protein PilQ
MRRLAGLLLPLLLGGVTARAADQEARVSLDLREAPVGDLLRLLADVGGFQLVLEPGVSCPLTLKLTGVRWQTALDMSLRACGLEREEEGNVLRIAPTGKLRQEAAERRALEEARRASTPSRIATFRLSYARAEQMAPLVKHWLAAGAEVMYDARTNTLIVVD